MVTIQQIHYQAEKSNTVTRTHKLSPTEWVTIIIILSGKREQTLSIIEDHMLEVISSVFWKEESQEVDFNFISENYNKFIRTTPLWEESILGMCFAVVSWETLMVSCIGESQAILTHPENDIEVIAEWNMNHNEFHAVSSGKIKEGINIYLSSTSILEKISDDLIIESSLVEDENWEKDFLSILWRESKESLHLIRIKNNRINKNKVHPGTVSKKFGKQIHLIQSQAIRIGELISLVAKRYKIPELGTLMKNKKTEYAFLFVGIALLFALIYSFIQAIFYTVNTPNKDSKNELLKAQTLIEESQKLTSNPASFNKNIEEAEKILLELKEEQLHIADTESLLGRIDAMKKEINDIETVNLSKTSSIVPFNASDISPVGCYEFDKKITLLGKQWAIFAYSRSEAIQKVTPYPNGEKLLDFDFSDDGNSFILTEANTLLSWKKWTLTYINASGQDVWEKAKKIKLFNGNIYLLSSDGRILYKHKPWINGFSSKTPSFETSWTASILDIWIDGWIYSISDEWKIIRFISGKPDYPKNIVINKVPWIYDIGKQEPLKFVVKPNLSYIYILSGRSLWIFEPNSKRFQDVTAWTYVAQVELQTNEEIRNVCIPRDWLLYTVTNLGLYETKFEIANWKIILR